MRLSPPILIAFCFSATIGFTGCNAGSESGVSSPGGDTAVNSNIAPVADAGLAQSAFLGKLITLDGSNSTDANGDLLNYRWSLLSKPGGSAALLSNPTAVRPTFTADTVGEYVVQLVVNDDRSDSAPVTTTVTAGVGNLRPVAHAGDDQNVRAEDQGVLITLHGEKSSDQNNDRLTYTWTFDQYPGSDQNPKPLPPVLTDPSTANPTFKALPGNYTVTLQVSDGTLLSPPDTVAIKADGRPTAVPGPCDPPSPPCQLFVKFDNSSMTINLDGSNSTDPNNDKLTYKWDITGTPDNSPITPDNPTAAKTFFTANQKGDYVAQLTVRDEFQSSLNTIMITVDDLKATVTPTSQKVLHTQEVTLNGNDDMDEYTWTLISSPGSSLDLSTQKGPTLKFTPDVVGQYKVQLTVKKGEPQDTSEPATIDVKTVLASAVSPVSVCSNVTLTAQSSDSSTFTWKVGGTTSPASFLASDTTPTGGGLVAEVTSGTGATDSVTINVDDKDRDPSPLGTVGHRMYHYGPDNTDNGITPNNLDCEECHSAEPHDHTSPYLKDLKGKAESDIRNRILSGTTTHTGGKVSDTPEVACRIKQLVNFLGNPAPSSKPGEHTGAP